MADRHSNRRGRPRSTASNSPPVPTLPSAASDTHRELVRELKAMAWRLTTAYCTCITVQAALEGQMADHDPEFARCLRGGVAESGSRQVERLHALVGRLTEAPPAPPR